ncbi:toprim domain-containing protein [Streptomyces sp. NPDC058256]|uniref:toprim domain-containing protein n=1 Tax=Streptomyces sp. NPDC058256 TaxID=3346408 RepID=UPI0036EE7DB1
MDEWTEHSLRAETGMDLENRTRLERDRIRAEDVVPRLGWSRPLVEVMRLAQDGCLLASPDGTYRQPGSGNKPGRRVNKQRVDLLLNAGFLALADTGTDGSALRPTPQGAQGLYLADLNPDGIHPDDHAAHAARLKGARRRWRTSDEAKAIAKRLPAMEKWDLKWSDDRPVSMPLADHAAATFATIIKAFDNLNYVARRRGPQGQRDRLDGIREVLAQTLAALDQGDFAQSSHGVLTAMAQAIAYQEAIADDPLSAETAAWVERLQEATDLYLTHWPAHPAGDSPHSAQHRVPIPRPVIADGPGSGNPAPLTARDQHQAPVRSDDWTASPERQPQDVAGRGTLSHAPEPGGTPASASGPRADATDADRATPTDSPQTASPAQAQAPGKGPWPAQDGAEAGASVIAGHETPPGPGASPAERGAYKRRFSIGYRVGMHVTYRDEEGEQVAARVVNTLANPILRTAEGHEFRADPEFQASRFIAVREDDGTALPAAAWTESVPEGHRLATFADVRQGTVIREAGVNGLLSVPRVLVTAEVLADGYHRLTARGISHDSGTYLTVDLRTNVVIDETDESQQLAARALKSRAARIMASGRSRERAATAADSPRSPAPDPPSLSTPQGKTVPSTSASGDPLADPVPADAAGGGNVPQTGTVANASPAQEPDAVGPVDALDAPPDTGTGPPQGTTPENGPASGLAKGPVLGEDWTLALVEGLAPLNSETWATAWALRGVLSDSALVDLMAVADDEDAFARWKSRHVGHYGEGTSYITNELAPAGGVRFKNDAKHFEARIADHTVSVTWDRVRAWLREATTPEALSLLQAAEMAGARLRDDSPGESLLAAAGELDLARALRARVTKLTSQILDHVVEFLAITPVPTTARGKRPPRAEEAVQSAKLFDLNAAPVFAPAAEKVRRDLDHLIAYLPDPHDEKEPESVPLSALRPGMVLDRGEKPVVITEIIRHSRRCDIIGDFRGPIWPARVKHSVELPDDDPDPHITLAPLLPSLRELTGQPPEAADDEGLGPLAEGHPAHGAPAVPGARPPDAPLLAPPVPRMPDLHWDEQRRRAHGQAIAARPGERPPLSARRREMDPDDPYAQFTDNIDHQLQQLSDRPAEHAAVERAAQEIRDTVSDLAARARAYSAARLRTAESDPSLLLQIALEPSLSGPFVRVAMNAIMHAIDTAEASVTTARAKARVHAALAAAVCSSPPRDPQGDSARDFSDALVEFGTLASNEQDTVAELLAGPAQWAHFADMAASIEAATASPDPPAPRFANVDEVRAHLAHLAERPLPDIESDPAGLIRHELRGRAKHAGNLATHPTLELTPSRRLAIYGSAGDGWRVVTPGSADNIVPWSVKTRRHALRYAALLESLTDPSGNAYLWDADDFPPAGTPYEPQGGHLLYDWVISNQSHHRLGFHYGLRLLLEGSQAYGWMEALARGGFSHYGYIHPAAPEGLQPGDEVMFTFDQDELTYAENVAGYFPPLQVDNLAIGTAAVQEDGTLKPGYWWPDRRSEQAQPLTQPVQLRDGARRPRPGEYRLHAGISAYLPEVARHQDAEARVPALTADGANPSVEDTPPTTADAAPAEPSSPAPSAEDRWAADAPPALAEPASGAAWAEDTDAPSALLEPRAAEEEKAVEEGASPAGEAEPAEPAGTVATAPVVAGAEPAAVTDDSPEARSPAGQPEYRKVTKAQQRALFDIARGDISEADGAFMKRTHRKTLERARSQKAVSDVLKLGLAERAGLQIRLSEHGIGWFTHYKIELPSSASRGELDVEDRGLPPIDYTPLAAFPSNQQPGRPQPPAPAPLRDDWYKVPPEAQTPERLQAAYDTAADARARAAMSTARDVAELAAGSDRVDRWVWSSQYPLAQYDENAAAALERLTDPAEQAYATQAVTQLRSAIEAVGREATADYVHRIRSAGSDPVAMDMAWRTTEGVQADDTYRFQVRGIVITYLIAVAEHTTTVGLDTEAIVNVLEDAAGWDGFLRQLGLKQIQYPHFPAAEQVSDAARFVADSVRQYALGQSEAIDAWAHRRGTWRTVDPRPANDEPTSAESNSAASPATQAEAGPTRAPAQEPDVIPSPAEEKQDLESEVGSAATQERGASERPDQTRGASSDEAEEEAPPMDRHPGRPEQAAPTVLATSAAGTQKTSADAPDQPAPAPDKPADAQSGGHVDDLDQEAGPGIAPGGTASNSAPEETVTAYTYPREATEAWQRLVDAFDALDRAHGSWPRTTRRQVDLSDVRRAVGILANQIPATPATLSEAAHQLRELEGLADVVRRELERSEDEEFQKRLGPALAELLEATYATHRRTQQSTHQLARDTSGTWLHPWVTEPPEGTQAITNSRPARTGERPGRVVHADGTTLRHIGVTEDSGPRAAVAVGALIAPRGTGLWQVVRFEDGTHDLVHPALLHSLDENPDPQTEDITIHPDISAARWRRFDRAEAAGENTAAMEALLVQPGDVVRVPNRKGERTVTRVERGVRRGRGSRRTTAVLWHIGPGRGKETDYAAKDQLEPIPVSLPPVRPGLTLALDGQYPSGVPAAPAPAALPPADDGPVPTTPDEPATPTTKSAAALSGIDAAAPAASDRPVAVAQEGGDNPTTPPAETSPTPHGQADEDLRESAAQASGTAPPWPSRQRETAQPATMTGSQPTPPVQNRRKGGMETSAQPTATAAKASGNHQDTAVEAQLDPESAAPYPNAAAYAAAHGALLTELGQQEQWLAATPAASEAADALAEADTLSLSLTALLALQSANAPTPDGDPHTRLTRRLGHHIHCTQLTLAKVVLAQAARSTSADQLADLHRMALRGQFIAFHQQTEDGEMQLGHYLQHRAGQFTRQTARSEDISEAETATAEEAATMAVDTDDDSQLPILELPGEALLTAAEAAPRLLAHAQTHLADGTAIVEPFAHIHGRPVYVLVTQQADTAPLLHLGLALPDGKENARTVNIGANELAVTTPETLLAAVTAWMNADDDGGSLLNYGPPTALQPPRTPTPDQAQPTAAEPEPHAPAAAPAEPTAATDTTEKPAASEPITTLNPQESAASPVPSTLDAPAAAVPGAHASAVSDPAGAVGEDTKAPTPAAEEQTTPPDAGGSPVSSDADAGPGGRQRQNQVGALQKPGAAGTPQQQPASADPNPVEQVTALARAALTDLDATMDATAVLTAPSTVLITLETSGNAERDREIADKLRTALHQAIRQHPDQSLAAYRIDFQHTPQVGQRSLQAAPVPVSAPVSRERLVAVNTEAAKIFAERLQSDPHAELARTYLAGERYVPPEVQQEWGLGYAPSDRGAGRWDILCRELLRRDFTEEELLQAGLASRSRYGGIIDYFDDRVMFPIHDEHGDIAGFSGRRIDRPGETEEQAKERQSQKYLNTRTTALFTKGDMVFGLHHPAQAQALAGSSGPRVSVEGYLDVIAVARSAAGLPLRQRPVVGAPMGTAFTERQLALLRALGTDNPRPHIVFLDNDAEGRKVLLDKWDLLLHAAGSTTVTTDPDAKDAAKLWEEGVKANGDGAAPVLSVLEQRRPLLDAAVEAVLLKKADEGERANHAFEDPERFYTRTQAIAAEAARYIHQAVQQRSPSDTGALEQAAGTWAKRLQQTWKIPGHMTASAVLLGPGNHDDDYANEVYQHALDLLAADPDGYFADDSHVRGRASAPPSAEDHPVTTPAPDAADGAPGAPGQWPAGTRGTAPAVPATATGEQTPTQGELALTMFLPGPPDGQLVELTDRTTAAYDLHTAIHDRLGQHTTETPEPDRLPQPLKLGTVHGIDLSTTGDDQTSEDPTVVLWLGPSRNDSLRLSYSRFTQMTGPELLAAVEWRAAQAAGLLGAPLTPTWREAVRSIIPSAFPARPTPLQLADLLNTIAQGPDGGDMRTRRRAEQALALYTAGHADLALNHLAAPDHIWVLRNDGTWIQEAAPGAELTWEELNDGFSQESTVIGEITQAAADLPSGDPAVDESPLAADLTVAHHSAHEALAALRPYSIGLPGTIYEKITDLVAQMDAGEPAMRRLRGPDGKLLMNRAKASYLRVLEGLATVASKIRLTGLSARLERTVARLRGQDPTTASAPGAARTDRRMQDLAHIERDLERRMAAPTTTLDKRGELQEQWIINRARRRARYEQLNGQPMDTDFLPDNGLVAGAPPVPNFIAAHEILLDRLRTRVAEQRDTDPHTGEDTNPYDPTGDLFNGVAWAYQQRLVGTVPTGPDPEGPIPAAQLRQAALTVTSHRDASPLTLRRTMAVSAERADRLLHRLSEHQILGPHRGDSPRTVLARPSDIDAMLARPATPPAPSPRQPARPTRATQGAEPERTDADEFDARIQTLVHKLLADQQERGKPPGGNSSAEPASPAPRARKAALQEAETNALAAGQPTSLAPSQS